MIGVQASRDARRREVRALLRPKDSKAWPKIAAIVVLIVFLYAGVLARLARDWWTYEENSHGLLIPPLALYIAFTRRTELFSAPAAADNRGIWLILGACLMFLAGKLGAEFFLTRLSLVVLLTGLTWTFWGGQRLRVLAPPLVLLVTMVPWPALVYNMAAAPLQLFASNVSTQVVKLAGVPVYQEGNIIHLAGMSLGVAEACSGLRSLSSLTVMALLVGFLQLSRFISRATLFILAIPIALGVNVLRVTGTALLVEVSPSVAEGFYHIFAGWLVFLLGLVLLVGLAKLLRSVMEPR